jgi:hypothetical protein
VKKRWLIRKGEGWWELYDLTHCTVMFDFHDPVCSLGDAFHQCRSYWLVVWQ